MGNGVAVGIGVGGTVVVGTCVDVVVEVVASTAPGEFAGSEDEQAASSTRQIAAARGRALVT